MFFFCLSLSPCLPPLITFSDSLLHDLLYSNMQVSFVFLMVTQSGLQDLSSPSRDLTWDTAVKCRVLITGPPGNFL